MFHDRVKVNWPVVSYFYVAHNIIILGRTHTPRENARPSESNPYVGTHHSILFYMWIIMSKHRTILCSNDCAGCVDIGIDIDIYS